MPLSKKTRDKRGRSIALITETRIKTTQDTSSGHPAQCWFCKKIAVIVFLLLFFFNYPCLGIAWGRAQRFQPKLLAKILGVEVTFSKRWLGYFFGLQPKIWSKLLALFFNIKKILGWISLWLKSEDSSIQKNIISIFPGKAYGCREVPCAVKKMNPGDAGSEQWKMLPRPQFPNFIHEFVAGRSMENINDMDSCRFWLWFWTWIHIVYTLKLHWKYLKNQMHSITVCVLSDMFFQKDSDIVSECFWHIRSDIFKSYLEDVYKKKHFLFGCLLDIFWMSFRYSLDFEKSQKVWRTFFVSSYWRKISNKHICKLYVSKSKIHCECHTSISFPFTQHKPTNSHFYPLWPPCRWPCWEPSWGAQADATGGTTTGYQNGAPQRGGHNGEATTGRPQRGGHNGEATTGPLYAR